MPTEQEKQCMACSCCMLIICAVVIPVVITQVNKNNPTAEWEMIGDPLWRDDSGLPDGNVALNDAGDRLLLVEFNQGVGVFDLVVGEKDGETVPQAYEEQASVGIPAPVVDLTSTFKQVGSLSGDGKTIAIGYPEERLEKDSDSLATGYVKVYQMDGNQAWTPKGTNPLSFESIMGQDVVYTGGYLGAATALSQDGNLLAIGITQVQGFPDANETSSFAYSSFVQVLEYNQNEDEWTELGPLIQGTCRSNSTGCIPCEGSFGPGEVDFGITLEMNNAGTRLAVGAPQASNCNAEQAIRGGFVRVFDYKVLAWEQVGADIVELDFNDAGNNFSPREFGLSLSLAGDNRLAVGSNAGAVIVDLDETSALPEWKFHEDFKWSTKSTFENYDTQISLTADGNKLAVSGPESQSNGGQINTYQWNDEGWAQYGKTIARNTGFGISLAISATDGKLLAAKGGYDTTVYQEP